MSHFSHDLSAGLLIAFGLAATIAVMIGLTRWARRRGTGAVATGALLSIFAPDPTLAEKMKLVEEAGQEKTGEEGEGEDKDPVT